MSYAVVFPVCTSLTRDRNATELNLELFSPRKAKLDTRTELQLAKKQHQKSRAALREVVESCADAVQHFITPMLNARNDLIKHVCSRAKRVTECARIERVAFDCFPDQAKVIQSYASADVEPITRGKYSSLAHKRAAKETQARERTRDLVEGVRRRREMAAKAAMPPPPSKLLLSLSDGEDPIRPSLPAVEPPARPPVTSISRVGPTLLSLKRPGDNTLQGPTLAPMLRGTPVGEMLPIRLVDSGDPCNKTHDMPPPYRSVNVA